MNRPVIARGAVAMLVGAYISTVNWSSDHYSRTTPEMFGWMLDPGGVAVAAIASLGVYWILTRFKKR